MTDQITIFSRSNNDLLFERMKEFIPEGFTVVKCDQFNYWHEAEDYLYHIIDTCPTKWAVNIDIDCFVFDWKEVEEIITTMSIWSDFFAGMPDGGVHPGRNNSPLSMNPFFNIFDVEKIRELKAKTHWTEISRTHYLYHNQEPFQGFFVWLSIEAMQLKQTGFKLLPELVDGEDTCLLKRPSGKTFCIHSWYSRLYGDQTEQGLMHTQRIDYWYNEAKRLQNERV